MHRGREYQLRISSGQLLLGDYLLRNSRFAQTGSHIENGIDANSFYSEYATGHGPSATNEADSSNCD